MSIFDTDEYQTLLGRRNAAWARVNEKARLYWHYRQALTAYEVSEALREAADDDSPRAARLRAAYDDVEAVDAAMDQLLLDEALSRQGGDQTADEIRMQFAR